MFVSSRNYVSFNYRAIDCENYHYDSYLKSVIENLEVLKRFEVKEMIYGAKDVPLFYLFMREKLATFKLFFWMSNIHHFLDYENKIFEESIISKDLVNLTRNVRES